jgi:hypothetical protein
MPATDPTFEDRNLLDSIAFFRIEGDATPMGPEGKENLSL